MATKKSIIKSDFDRLYNDLGNDLKDFLPSLSPKGPWTIESHSIKVGKKWHLNASPNPFLLLQITQNELSIVTTRYPTAKGSVCLADRFFKDSAGNLVLYVSTDHPGTYFLLTEEWGDNSKGNKSICDLINGFASSFGKGPYIPAEEETVLMTPKRLQKQNPGIDAKPKKGAGAGGEEPGSASSSDDTDVDNDHKYPLNLILYGPPGTGKTYHTVNKALEILTGRDWSSEKREDAIAEYNKFKGNGQIVFTTFHQSMSYEDFVEGIKPNLDGKSVGYKIEDGIFKQIAQTASMEGNRDKPYVLIIDEINRGNVANIFGELITLIEEDKRKGCPEEISVTLPYSKEPFSVPKNLYIIGTMNTADRSVEALDSALRRRFSFEEMMPEPKLLKNTQIKGIGKSLEELLATINERIEVLKDREHQIGHSYFMMFKDRIEVEPNELKCIFTDKIIPLLQEYFYGDYEKIKLVVGDGFVSENSTKVTFAGNNSSYDEYPEKRYTIEKEPKMESAIMTLLNI